MVGTKQLGPTGHDQPSRNYRALAAQTVESRSTLPLRKNGSSSLAKARLDSPGVQEWEKYSSEVDTILMHSSKRAPSAALQCAGLYVGWGGTNPYSDAVQLQAPGRLHFF